MGMFSNIQRRGKYMLKNFPIDVTIYKVYHNGIKPHIYSGFYDKRYMKGEEGSVQKRYLVVKKGGFFSREYMDIPYFHIADFNFLEGKQDIQLFEIALNDFHVCQWRPDGMFVWDRTYVTDENGTPVKFKVGKENKPELTAEGRPIPDENGAPIVTWEGWRLVFDNTTTLLDGERAHIPALVAKKTYDTEEWLGTENMEDMNLYKPRGFWDKYGYLVAAIILILVMAVGVKVTLDSQAEIVKNQALLMEQMKGFLQVLSAGKPVPTPPP